MALDEQLAEQMVEQDDADGPGRWLRSHRDYTPEVEMLTAVYDRLGELISITAAVRGARGKSANPGPRPIYAVERTRKRMKENKHQSLVSRLIKKKSAE